MTEVPLPPLLAPGAAGAPPASGTATAPARLPVHLRHTGQALTQAGQECRCQHVDLSAGMARFQPHDQRLAHHQIADPGRGDDQRACRDGAQ